MATDPYNKQKLKGLRAGDPGFVPGLLPYGSPMPKAPAPAPRRTGLRGALDSVANEAQQFSNDLGYSLREARRDPLGAAEKALTPLGPEVGALGAGSNLVKQAGVIANAKRVAKANPFKYNNVQRVVDSKAMRAGARVVDETQSGLRRFVAPVAGVATLGAAATAATQQDNAAAEAARQAAMEAARGGPEEAAPEEAPATPARFITTGRDANGNLVASSEGPQDVAGLSQRSSGGLARGLRSISFKPEAPDAAEKAAAASEQFYKNIGGDLATQQAAASQALADQAAGENGATRGLRGASRTTGGAGDTPLDFAKYGLDVAKFNQDKEKAAAEADAKNTSEQRERGDARAEAYMAQLGDNAGPGDFEDAQLLAQYDRLKESDANLFDANDKSTRPTRENLQQRATDLINARFRRYTTIDPDQPIAPKVGSADLSGFGKGAYRGGLKALVPDFIDDFGGSFTYTDESGETYYANADEFNPVQLEILRRAADLGGKDKAVKGR